MSELTNISNTRREFRWQLLATVSALALLGSVYAAGQSEAADQNSDRPTIWIELGGQLEGLDASEQQFAPAFVLAAPRPSPETISPLSVEHAPRFSNGGEGKISFEPDDTNWVFTAAIRYGRSNASRGLHQQSYPTKGIPQIQFPSGATPSTVPVENRKALQFIDAQGQNSESHIILDFQAGRDVGLGMFGAGSSSIFNFGIRFAQFGSKSSTAFKSDPDAHPLYKYFSGLKAHLSGAYHFNAATASTTRSFRGVGPSLSWNASAPVLGNPQGGQVAFDWGVNATILFGRQRAKVHHQTTAQYHKGKYSSHYTTHPFRTTLYRNTPPDQARSRFVTVPNIGGFAGASFRYSIAKISIGYRADFFFGAMDGGIDTARKENVGFYGPFASVSVGIGG